MFNVITLLLAESALEPIPRQLWKHPLIKRYAQSSQNPPQTLLLDRSYHHAVMGGLPQNHKRGRPDIVHFTLLAALGSPLNKERMLRTYVHTITNQVITVNPTTRLPKNYNRFVGLMEALFRDGRVPPTGPVLLEVTKKTPAELIAMVNPTYVVAFSRGGTPRLLEDVAGRLSQDERPAVIVGGFPHGQLSATTTRVADEIVSIDPDMMETWTVVSRILYAYERAIALPKKRLGL